MFAATHDCMAAGSPGIYPVLYISLSSGCTHAGVEMVYTPLAVLLCFFLAGAAGFAPGNSMCIASQNARKSFPVQLHASNAARQDKDRDLRIVRLQQSEREHENRVMKLEREVKSLESAVRELCSALLYCDDIALMERQSRCVGEIYMDSDFSKIRSPRLLRQEISSVMQTHNIARKPLMYSWRYKTSKNVSVRTESPEDPVP